MCPVPAFQHELFLSTLPARGATRSSWTVTSLLPFLSTLPARGATIRTASPFRWMTYFYPRSPRGERQLFRARRGAGGSDFYPRSPRGERPFNPPETRSNFIFLSTLPARGATSGISAPERCRTISIHAPREGSDEELVSGLHDAVLFLSTLPARGATPIMLTSSRRMENFYPRSPRGERLGTDQKPFQQGNFYPRSPRGERQRQPSNSYSDSVFLSTLPARGATLDSIKRYAKIIISIHAPREGSDAALPVKPIASRVFLSTLPARGATSGVVALASRRVISIHAPREGSDKKIFYDRDICEFLSTLPARGAT